MPKVVLLSTGLGVVEELGEGLTRALLPIPLRPLTLPAFGALHGTVGIVRAVALAMLQGGRSTTVGSHYLILLVLIQTLTVAQGHPLQIGLKNVDVPVTASPAGSFARQSALGFLQGAIGGLHVILIHTVLDIFTPQVLNIVVESTSIQLGPLFLLPHLRLVPLALFGADLSPDSLLLGVTDLEAAIVIQLVVAYPRSFQTTNGDLLGVPGCLSPGRLLPHI